MTRTPTKSAVRALYPDWQDVLARAEAVRVQRECFLCGSVTSAKKRMGTMDEWQCAAGDADCGRRAMKREWGN